MPAIPWGYYKEKSLGSGEQEKVAGYIREITGCTPEEVENMPRAIFLQTQSMRKYLLPEGMGTVPILSGKMAEDL